MKRGVLVVYLRSRSQDFREDGLYECHTDRVTQRGECEAQQELLHCHGWSIAAPLLTFWTPLWQIYCVVNCQNITAE